VKTSSKYCTLVQYLAPLRYALPYNWVHRRHSTASDWQGARLGKCSVHEEKLHKVASQHQRALHAINNQHLTCLQFRSGTYVIFCHRQYLFTRSLSLGLFAQRFTPVTWNVYSTSIFAAHVAHVQGHHALLHSVWIHILMYSCDCRRHFHLLINASHSAGTASSPAKADTGGFQWKVIIFAQRPIPEGSALRSAPDVRNGPVLLQSETASARKCMRWLGDKATLVK
jgi:hypothetical protein